jgi:hypothetical protein
MMSATPPSRNNLSHADKIRPAEMAEKLFWSVFEHLGSLSPCFVSSQGGNAICPPVQTHNSPG